MLSRDAQLGAIIAQLIAVLRLVIASTPWFLFPALCVSQSGQRGSPHEASSRDAPIQLAFNPDLPIAEQHAKGILKPPKPLVTPDFKFSEPTKPSKSVTVELYLWVDREGRPSHMRLISALGHGLNEQFLDQARAYRFKPATLNGVPVTYDLYVDVNIDIF